MVPVVTTAAMRAIDQEAIRGDVAVGYRYMHMAGTGLCESADRLLSRRCSGSIAIVCGKGNNGGDGFVAGRLLHEKGYTVTCFALCAAAELSGEALLAYKDYRRAHGTVVHIGDVSDCKGFAGFDLIIDALLGTGAQGNPRGGYADVIRAINASGKTVLAVDTPSGLDNDTGLPGDPTVKATCTMTLGFPKIGQLFYPGRIAIGDLQIKELGYPDDCVARFGSSLFLPVRDDVARMIPQRKPDGSKFDHGLVFMLCGSRGMTGSVILAAMAAMRSGCGMVHCAVPGSAIPVLSARLTEPVLHGIPETDSGAPSADAIAAVIEAATGMHAVLAGPGLSHGAETADLVRSLVCKSTLPLVLDADGINAFKGRAGELKSHAGEIIITPHAGEWKRIFGPLPAEPAARIGDLKDKAREFAMTIVYKGNPTIVATARGDAYILPVGNSALATAGSGDVLAGIIVSLLAQGAAPVYAAVGGVAIHGLAGESAAGRLGEYSVIAGDIVDHIHHVFMVLSPRTTYSLFGISKEIAGDL
jgi:NAD(P)H-hydrate epimerase